MSSLPGKLLAMLLFAQLFAFGLGSYVLLERCRLLYDFFENLQMLFLLGLLCHLFLSLRSRGGRAADVSSRHKALAAYLAVLLLNLFRSASSDGTVVLGAFMLSVFPFVVYGLACVLLDLETGRRCLPFVFVASSIIAAVPALLEYALGLDGMPPWLDLRFESDMTRATGFLANPIILGAVFVFMFFWTLGWLMEAEPGSSTRRLLHFACALQLSVVYVSFTRAAWLSLWAGVLVFYLISRGRTGSHLPLFYALLLIGVVLLAPTGRRRLETLAYMRHRSNSTRIERWTRCLHYVARRPVLGHGLGTTCGVAANQGGIRGAFYAHNYLLQLWVELGLAGLVPFVVFWWLFVGNALKLEAHPSRRAGLAGLFAFFTHSMVVGHFEYPPVAVMLGLSMAMVERLSPRCQPRSSMAGGRFQVAPAILPALALLAAVAVVQLRADMFQYELQQAHGLASKGRVGEAVELLRDVLGWNPCFLEAERRLAAGWLSAWTRRKRPSAGGPKGEALLPGAERAVPARQQSPPGPCSSN